MLPALLTMVGLAAAAGVAAAFAARRSERDRNRLVDEIDALLPQTQCGRCTFTGCRPYADSARERRSRHQSVPARRRRHGGGAREAAGSRAAPGGSALRQRARATDGRVDRRGRVHRLHEMHPGLPGRRDRRRVQASCTPSSRRSARAASCAFRPAPSTASTCGRRRRG